MHWLPTYMKSSLNAEHKDIMYTAAPYILNSIAGVGEFGVQLKPVFGLGQLCFHRLIAFAPVLR